jgi:hypothetical protein
VLRLETLDRLGGAERIVPAHLETAMAELSPAERNLSARIFRFLVTPSGTKIAHHAFDLADYAQVTAEKIQPLLDRLSGPQARILRGTGAGRYEIYHDVLAAAILDWRAHYLQAKGARQRRLIAFACLLVLFTGGIVYYQHTSPRTTQQVLVGWLIGLSVTAVVVMFGFWLWAFYVRRGTRQRRRIFIFLFCLLIGSGVAHAFAPSALWWNITGPLNDLSVIGVLVLIVGWLWTRRARRQS